MIDPITAIGAATAAFNGIKTAISTGKDIQSMTAQLGQWGKAISDLDYAHNKAENPPWYKAAFGQDVQKNAMEVWIQKKKAQDMREELRSYISLYYGPSSWDEIVAIEAQMRKEQKEAAYRAQEAKEQAIAWVLGLLLTGLGIAICGGIIYLIGVGQGRW